MAFRPLWDELTLSNGRYLRIPAEVRKRTWGIAAIRVALGKKVFVPANAIAAAMRRKLQAQQARVYQCASSSAFSIELELKAK
jgi:hypothetical protein